MRWWPFGRKEEDVRVGVDDLLPTTDVKAYEKTQGFRDYKKPSRKEALKYVPFARCVDLIAKQAADLTDATLRVVDDDGNLVDKPRARAAVRLLRHSPDGVHTGQEFIKDLMGDYLIEGNALVAVEVTRGLTSNTPTRLTRLNAETATTRLGSPDEGLNSLTYTAHPFGFKTAQVYPASHIVHAKFATRSAEYMGDGTRSIFAESPLVYLAQALFIGKMSDQWVGSFFDESAKNNMIIRFPHEMGKQEIQRTVEAYKLHQTRKRDALFLYGGATAEIISPSAQDADALKLREYGVQEIGRFYGVPAPLLGLHVTQWGSGIEHLARLYFRFSVRLHLGVLLDALSFRLLPEGQKFEIDPTQEVKGDMAAMSQFVSAMRPNTNNPAVMSREEVRDMIGARGTFNDDWDWDSAQNEEGDESGSEGGGQPTQDRVPFRPRMVEGGSNDR